MTFFFHSDYLTGHIDKFELDDKKKPNENKKRKQQQNNKKNNNNNNDQLKLYPICR